MSVHQKVANGRAGGLDGVESRADAESASIACRSEVVRLQQQLRHTEEEMRIWRAQAVALRHEIDIVLQTTRQANAPNGQTSLQEIVHGANLKARVKARLMPFWRRCVPEFMKPSMRSFIRWLIRKTIG